MKSVYDRLHVHLLKQEVIHADETTAQVLHEDGKTTESISVYIAMIISEELCGMISASGRLIFIYHNSVFFKCPTRIKPYI